MFHVSLVYKKEDYAFDVRIQLIFLIQTKLSLYSEQKPAIMQEPKKPYLDILFVDINR